jgi:hypothetical protein
MWALAAIAAAAASPAVAAAAGEGNVLDPSVLDRLFDGHGGLSAGASSRLLYECV